MRFIRPALVVALVAGTLAFAPSAAQAAAPAANTLESTIALNNCSASLVRYPASQDTDRALMLTNGHCYEGGFLADGEVLQNRSSTRSGTLLNADGSSSGTVRADRLLYATMTGTDVALYRLTETYAALLTRTGRSPLTLAASHPVAGTSSRSNPVTGNGSGAVTSRPSSPRCARATGPGATRLATRVPVATSSAAVPARRSST